MSPRVAGLVQTKKKGNPGMSVMASNSRNIASLLSRLERPAHLSFHAIECAIFVH